jgi:hypothetical protein
MRDLCDFRVIDREAIMCECKLGSGISKFLCVERVEAKNGRNYADFVGEVFEEEPRNNRKAKWEYPFRNVHKLCDEAERK